MKKCFVAAMIGLFMFLDFIGLVKANSLETQKLFTPVVLLDGEELSFNSEPIFLNNRVMVPLREVTEILGAEVTWQDGGQVEIRRVENAEEELVVALCAEDEEVLVLSKRQVFFLDQPAKIIDNRIFIPLRFFGPALNLGVEWDEQEQRVLLESNKYKQDPNPDANYYKLYDLLVGGSGYPLKKAAEFVLAQKYLEKVESVREVPSTLPLIAGAGLNFNTQVSGLDASGRKKVLWVDSRYRYWDSPEVVRELFLDEGIPQETVIDDLEQKGISSNAISDIYLDYQSGFSQIKPELAGRICWYVLVQYVDENSTNMYVYDFGSGELIYEIDFPTDLNLPSSSKNPFY